MIDQDLRPHLIRSIDLAVVNAQNGGRPFGAIVLLEDEILAEGVNTTLVDGDPTSHAEVVAVRSACAKLTTLRLDGATLVASCEPCPMCQALAFSVGINRMVYAASANEAAAAGWPFAPGVIDLQEAWRASFAGRATHLPLPSSSTPFDHWNAHTSQSMSRD